MKGTDRNPLGLYSIGIAALFLAGFFLLVVFGAQSYRSVAVGQEGNMDSRTLLSYIATSIKANDTAGAVTVSRGEQGTVLAIEDGSSGYVLRLYLHEGNLVEDFNALDAALSPDSAQVIGATDTFEAEYITDGLLCVRTDAGRVLLHLRSGEA